jgi:hypothetical protein
MIVDFRGYLGFLGILVEFEDGCGFMRMFGEYLGFKS